jgi:hypothetical protein
MSKRSKFLTVFFWVLLLVAAGLSIMVQMRMDERFMAMDRQIQEISNIIEIMNNE